MVWTSSTLCTFSLWIHLVPFIPSINRWDSYTQKDSKWIPKINWKITLISVDTKWLLSWMVATRNVQISWGVLLFGVNLICHPLPLVLLSHLLFSPQIFLYFQMLTPSFLPTSQAHTCEKRRRETNLFIFIYWQYNESLQSYSIQYI